MIKIKSIIGATLAVVLGLSGSAQAASTKAKLFWHNESSGEISTWLLNGAGIVNGDPRLNWNCAENSGCTRDWKPIGFGDINSDGFTDLTWYNATTGVVSAWLLNGSNTVSARKDLTWTCTAASNCARDWKPVGFGDINSDGFTDLTWYNATTGVVSAWLLDGSGTVTGTKELNAKCTAASGCVRDWKAIGFGDVNSDGFTDLTWYNATTGVVSAWLLNGSGTVTGTKEIDWKCTAASNCARDWKPVGFGDVNSDSFTDLTWYNSTTGEISSWLLNGSGIVNGTKELDWKCNAASGCTNDWKPIGITK
jgi:hypothetical protein